MFIEERYWKRFGGDPHDHCPNVDPGSRKPPLPQRDAHAPEHVRKAAWQVGDLVCYLMNLADDLQKWLGQGMIASEVLPRVAEELREIASALDTGAPVHPIPGIAFPPRPTRPAFSERGDLEPTFEDDIPF